MSSSLLAVLILAPTIAVVVAMFIVMWLERTSTRDAWIAVGGGVFLAAWAAVSVVLSARNVFVQPDVRTTPPVGIALIVTLAALTVFLVASRSLRGLLSNQKNLIRLNMWRLVGAVFLLLMFNGQVPALWAWPAGVGDIIVGAAAPWVASRLDAPGGRRRAIIFNLFGVTDLIVAVGLGITTNPGPVQLFHTTPTAALMTRFPMALVPTFLVPLAFMLHIVSLWQLFGGTWARQLADLAE
jgi:hypothetical protein